MRVVSLCPSNTEIVLALGLRDRLVGADRWSLKDPAFALDVAEVGSDLDVDVDAVAALRPDLVLASLSVPGMERNVERLRERGLPFIVVDAHDWAGVRRGVQQVADALGEADRGRALVAEMDAAAEEVRRNAAAARARMESPPETGAWEWWPKPIIVAGRPSWVTDIFAFLGLRNAFADLDRESGPVEPDEVRARDPDVLCASWCGTAERRMRVADIAGRPGWGELRAIRERRVFLLPESLFGRPGPGLVKGLRMLFDFLYGDADAAAREAARRADLAADAFAWPPATEGAGAG